MRDNTAKYLNWASGLAILLCGAVLLLFLFFMVYPYKTAEIKVPIQVLNENKEVKVGEPIKMFIVLDKYADIKPTVDTFVSCNDFNTVPLEARGAARPVGHYEFAVNIYTLPAGVKTGAICKFNFRNEYKVNPIRVITKNWYSEQFKVVE